MKDRSPSKFLILKTKVYRSIAKYRKYIFFTIILVLIYLLFQTDPFTISKVNFSSDNKEELQSIDSGLKDKATKSFLGENYISANANLVSDLMKENSYVKSFWVEKKLPNTINIVIKQRDPKYLIIYEDGLECAVLDSEAFTVEFDNDIETCEMKVKESNLSKISVKPFPTFKRNTQSSFYYILNLVDIEKVFDNYGYRIEQVNIVDGVTTLKVQNGSEIIISFNQDLKIQLARFVVVIEDINSKNMKFSLLDLRYERPVIKAE